MCLKIDSSVAIKFDANGYAKLWKHFTKKNGKLVTTYRNKRVTSNQLISNRKTTKFSRQERKEKEINRGIHVFLTRSARRHNAYSFCTIKRVMCHKDDLVATGYFANLESAVFMKVVIL